MKPPKYLLEITTFFCGGIVMIFELVGSRILGPYFGTSIFIWTSLIGVILGSLSLGYYLGGKIADKKLNLAILSFIVFMGAVFVVITTFFKDYFLIILEKNLSYPRIASTLASLLLFAPASIFLGMVSPYIVKLKIKHLQNSGKTIGNLYAISTLGSIFGTFLAGFYLIPHFGAHKILIILASVLTLISLFLFWKNKFEFKIIFLLFLIFFSLFFNKTNNLEKALGKTNFLDLETAYNRIWIYDFKQQKNGKTVKVLGINNENHSAMFLENDELVNEYTKYYDLVKHFNPTFKETLMLGGAGYSYPKHFLANYPQASIDVVEIDPQLTEIAKKYFRLQNNPRLSIHHNDGRVFLNKTSKKYDAIFGDAFSSRYSIPYQLTTLEATQKKYNALRANGIVILNIISAINGDKGEFLRAEYKTYKKVFPQVYLFATRNPKDDSLVQNIILVALKSKERPKFTSNNQQINQFLKNQWKEKINLDIPILTDDFAPVDYYINKTL